MHRKEMRDTCESNQTIWAYHYCDIYRRNIKIFDSAVHTSQYLWVGIDVDITDDRKGKTKRRGRDIGLFN